MHTAFFSQDLNATCATFRISISKPRNLPNGTMLKLQRNLAALCKLTTLLCCSLSTKCHWRSCMVSQISRFVMISIQSLQSHRVHYLSASMSPKSLRWAISPFPNIRQAKNMLANLDAKANGLYVPGALYTSCLHTIHVSYLVKSLLIVYLQEYLSFSLTLPPHVPTFPLSWWSLHAEATTTAASSGTGLTVSGHTTTVNDTGSDSDLSHDNSSQSASHSDVTGNTATTSAHSDNSEHSNDSLKNNIDAKVILQSFPIPSVQASCPIQMYKHVQSLPHFNCMWMQVPLRVNLASKRLTTAMQKLEKSTVAPSKVAPLHF